MSKKTRRTPPGCRPAAPDRPRADHAGAAADDKRVTLAQALAVLFEHDLHPSTGTSRHTIDSYKTTFRLLLRFVEQCRSDLLPSNTPVECFDALLVEAFLRHLQKERRSSAVTLNVRRAAFGALARAVQRRYPHLTPYCRSLLAIRSRKTPQVLVGYFELNELEAIFGAVDTSTPDGFRDLVLLRCLYNTGARASELCGLRHSDLRLAEPAHVVLHGKGGKTRTVPLWPATADLLRAYLKAARRTPKPGHQDLVFIGRRGNALTRQGLYKIARHHVDTAARKLPQLARRELHPVCSFRHTTATHLLMAGVSLPEIQDLLGHARLETTMRYPVVSLERKRHALARLLELRIQKSSQADQTPPQPADHQNLIDWLERL
jgi:site-specific recombinase XerD